MAGGVYSHFWLPLACFVGFLWWSRVVQVILFSLRLLSAIKYSPKFNESILQLAVILYTVW